MEINLSTERGFTSSASYDGMREPLVNAAWMNLLQGVEPGKSYLLTMNEDYNIFTRKTLVSFSIVEVTHGP